MTISPSGYYLECHKCNTSIYGEYYELTHNQGWVVWTYPPDYELYDATVWCPRCIQEYEDKQKSDEINRQLGAFI
jgi:hypothetical protein